MRSDDRHELPKIPFVVTKVKSEVAEECRELWTDGANRRPVSIVLATTAYLPRKNREDF